MDGSDSGAGVGRGPPLAGGSRLARRSRSRGREMMVAAQPREVLVAAGVVAVHVRVDEVLDRGVGDLADRGDDPVGHLGKLRVHEEHAIGADQRAHPPPLAVDRVEVVAELGRRDLDRLLGLLRGGCGWRESAERTESAARANEGRMLMVGFLGCARVARGGLIRMQHGGLAGQGASGLPGHSRGGGGRGMTPV